ncbi:hypothetical protein PoB_006688700 [Plakobranchus ocellatus]|uniref:Uncharacterized protein n=1 Tax=Plakobranchus ocellatus TaxID=259542 RepID=A0AAV4D802_9GAST|nr:hypothetical protein PoB_006688700 [Plakobranchus ocellatus]
MEAGEATIEKAETGNKQQQENQQQQQQQQLPAKDETATRVAAAEVATGGQAAAEVTRGSVKGTLCSLSGLLSIIIQERLPDFAKQAEHLNTTIRPKWSRGLSWNSMFKFGLRLSTSGLRGRQTIKTNTMEL